MVISGDVITDFDLSRLIEFHKKKGAMVTIGLAHVQNPLEYGVVMTDADGKVSRFLEKPGWSEVFSDTVNTGIYIIEREVLRQIDSEKQYRFLQRSVSENIAKWRSDLRAASGRVLV